MQKRLRHGNETGFSIFLNINRFRIGPYAQPFKSFQFWLRIRGDICNRKSTPRPFPTSVIQGDADSPYRWYGELANELVKENSLYRWYGELSTPRIGVTVRQRLPISVKWGSTTFRTAESGVGESLVISLDIYVHCQIKIDNMYKIWLSLY